MRNSIKILQALVNQPVGGVGTFLNNMFEVMEDVELEIIESSSTLEGRFNSFFLDRGVKINLFPSIWKQVSYFAACRKYYRDNARTIDIVHVHSPANALPHLYYSKKYGISKRIYHAHSTKWSDSRLKSLRNCLLVKLSLPLATHFFACGRLAGENILGNRSFTIIPNTIDVASFMFSREKATTLRQELQISPEKMILGCVGTMDSNKNQKILIDMMKYLPQEKYELVLIGAGILEEDLKAKADGLPNIHFLGRRENIRDYYSMMDILLLPSFFEGFPMVAVEAQANGLPLLVSNSVDNTIDITGEVLFASVTEEDVSRKWASLVQTIERFDSDKRKRMNEIVKAKGYDIESGRSLLLSSYKRILGE